MLILSLAFLVACSDDDPAEPGDPLTVVITGPAQLESEFSAENGDFSCDYLVTASTQGGQSGQAAIWQGSTAIIRRNGVIIDTIEYSAEEIAGFWGSDRIVRGQSITPEGWLVFSDAVPFEYTEAFRYRIPSGEIRTAEYTLDCL